MAVRGVVVDQFLLKSINVAHSLARKAEESEEIGEIAKAIDYHGTAAVILQEFLESSEGEIGFHMKLSLKCQYNYHKNRAKFLTAIDAYKVIHCLIFRISTNINIYVEWRHEVPWIKLTILTFSPQK